MDQCFRLFFNYGDSQQQMFFERQNFDNLSVTSHRCENKWFHSLVVQFKSSIREFRTSVWGITVICISLCTSFLEDVCAFINTHRAWLAKAGCSRNHVEYDFTALDKVMALKVCMCSIDYQPCCAVAPPTSITVLNTALNTSKDEEENTSSGR